jgi:hypothetical protein
MPARIPKEDVNVVGGNEDETTIPVTPAVDGGVPVDVWLQMPESTASRSSEKSSDTASVIPADSAAHGSVTPSNATPPAMPRRIGNVLVGSSVK